MRYKKIKNTSLAYLTLVSLGLSLSAVDDGLAPEVVDLNAKDVSMEWEQNIPYLEHPYFSSRPIKKGDDILVGELGFEGENKQLIESFSRAIAKESFAEGKSKTDSLLISYKGKLVFESYYRRGRQNVPHFQMSITKSYTAFALGRAIQLGYLSMDDLNKPVVSFLTKLDPLKLCAGADKITLAEALNMTSGIKLINDKMKNYKTHPERLKGQLQAQAYLACSEQIPAAPRKFSYQPADPALIMQVLESVVPGSAKDFIERELMGKMGIINYSWQLDTSGLPKSAAGSSFTSRDMIKVGTMVLQNGKWKGEQLIPKKFIKRAFSPITLSYGSNFYGYFCWYQDIRVGDLIIPCFQLRGALGQYTFIFPKQELVVVSTGHGAMGPMLGDISQKILPAFIQ